MCRDQVDESISKPIPELTNEKQNEPECEFHQPISGCGHHGLRACLYQLLTTTIDPRLTIVSWGYSLRSPDPSQRASPQKNEGDKKHPCNNHHQKPPEEVIVGEESRAVVHDNDIGNGSREQETNVRTTTPTIIVETEDDECAQQMLKDPTEQGKKQCPIHSMIQQKQGRKWCLIHSMIQQKQGRKQCPIHSMIQQKQGRKWCLIHSMIQQKQGRKWYLFRPMIKQNHSKTNVHWVVTRVRTFTSK